MKRWLLVVLAFPAFAAPSVRLMGVTQTQAAVAITGYSGGCSLALSESTTYAPLHPDVDASKHSGADTDSLRPDTITWSDGTRVVTLGHRLGDRALAAATTYYLRVSGCGGTATTTFGTSTIDNRTVEGPLPFDPSGWGNMAVPPVDISRDSGWLVDPLTGVKLKPINHAGDWTWRTWATNSGAYLYFPSFDKGIGWMSPGTVLSGPTSTATTSGTNPIELYLSQICRQNFVDAYYCDPYAMQDSLDDLGIVLWGSGTDASAANRTVQICLFHDPAGSCLGTPLTVVLPMQFGPVLSGSSDPDGAWPAIFPKPFFSGWGLTAPMGLDNWNLGTTISASAGAFTIATPDSRHHIPAALAPGNKVYVAGSSPQCANDLCTVATLNGQAGGTFVENVTVAAGTAATFYRTGIRVSKTTNTGSITLGAAYKFAGSLTLTQPDAGHPQCGPEFSTTAGKGGHLCSLERGPAGYAVMYFIDSDGMTLPVWSYQTPSSAYFQSQGFADADVPQTCCTAPPALPGGTNGRVWYVYMGTQRDGKGELYRLTYTGDGTVSGAITDYTMAPDGSSRVVNPPSDFFTWETLTPVGHTLAEQIAQRYPNYNATMYGSSWGFYGISGSTAYYSNVYSGQDHGPAWYALLDLNQTPAVLTDLIHTADGTGTNGNLRWGAHHTLAPTASVPDTATTTLNELQSNDTSQLHGGPFQAKITGILRNGSWSTDTSLPWPIDGSYDSACPTGNSYQFMGASGNQCVTLRFPQGGVCNIAPRADEKAAWPCRWNTSYAQPFSLAVGDNFVDAGIGGGVPGDCEHFRIISISTEPDNQLRVVAQRNAIWDYCCISGTHTFGSGQSNCLDSVNQATHAGGWTAVMFAPRLNGCSTGEFNFQGKAESSLTFSEIGRTLLGHGEIAPGITPGNVSFITTGLGRIDMPFSQLFSLPTSPTIFSLPVWAGITLPVGGGVVQAYVNTPGGVPWMVDDDSLNDNWGGGTVGSRTLTATATPKIYRIQALGDVDYKAFPLVGYSGGSILKDVSGPSSDLTTAADYSMCYAFQAGECYKGSSSGELYVRVPNVYDIGACPVGQIWINSPCVLSEFPGGGWTRQQRISAADPASTGTHLLTTLLTSPGMHPTYSSLTAIDGGMAIGSPTPLANWGTVAWLVNLPPWQEDSIPRNDFVRIPVQVPGGPAYAEIVFGYGDNGLPGQFRCTPRAESCNSSGKPFAFDSESRTLTYCANGCTIQVSALPGRLLWYAVRRSSKADGSGDLTTGSPQLVAVMDGYSAQYFLTIQVSPAGAGTVTANPSPPDGYYSNGAAVQLTATANSNYQFTGWSGDLSGSANPQTATVTKRLNVTANFAGPNPIFDNAFFVSQLYRDLLGREPDAAGLNFWVGQLNSGLATRAQVAYSYFVSPEFQSNGLFIISAYLAVLGRNPDYNGWLYNLSNLWAGVTKQQEISAFIQSTEFQLTYGTLDNTHFIQTVYQNVLSRAPDAVGLNYWVGQLNSGAMSRTDIMYAFTTSGEFQTRIQNQALATLLYMGFLRRSPDNAGVTYWTGQLNYGVSPATC